MPRCKSRRKRASISLRVGSLDFPSGGFSAGIFHVSSFYFKNTNILVGKSIFRMYMGSKQATKTRQKRSKNKKMTVACIICICLAVIACRISIGFLACSFTDVVLHKSRSRKLNAHSARNTPPRGGALRNLLKFKNMYIYLFIFTSPSPPAHSAGG